ncbi:hypothetical protein Nepgr_026933 [Nepenthes gracilis]|uniref:Thaumatin-like protein n=1 Tax=Nepenthes gracilis TaxID=150966 RepID=A0AAD3T8Y8_NEPGR|nr:hypothetical protein Nepgr_026933 [Nepenthes gracilis]
MGPYLYVPLTVLLLLTISSGPRFGECANLTLLNHCKETIWPAILPGDNFTDDVDGTALKPGKFAVLTAPPGWHGRIWGRTGCSFEGGGNGTCQTGGCGNSLKCSEPGKSPATLAEFSLGQQSLDFYDVSLVSGFNIPITVTPLRGKGNCSTAGCDGDLRDSCPSELAVKAENGKTVIGCQSACDAFDTDEYCCRGMYADPVSCRSSNYSSSFKRVCPAAYSYAFDGPTSVITCSASDYVVSFCASRNQSACAYRDQNLVCNGAGGTGASSPAWLILFITMSSLLGLNICVKSFSEVVHKICC